MKRCDKCGRYLPTKGHITYTEYSGTSEFEPREPINLHNACYEKSDKELINKVSWIKPHFI
jgi:hypothetical protein